jgi:thiaminase/transcriptional activator TenA
MAEDATSGSVLGVAGEDGFSAGAWSHTAALQQAIADHPFNAALAAGTLDRERFVFYLVQDAAYLVGFSRALGVAASRASDPGDAALLTGSAHSALVVERSLHDRWLAAHGADRAGVEVSPSCEAYASWVQAVALAEPFPVQVASLLPCFWIYREVGTAIHRRTAEVVDHPYRAWIDTYADEAFSATVDAVIALADRQAAVSPPDVRSRMLAAFTRASEHEWRFWDSAWRREGWPTARWRT